MSEPDNCPPLSAALPFTSTEGSATVSQMPSIDHGPQPSGTRSAGRTEAEAFLQGRLVLLHKLLFFLTGGGWVVSMLVLGLLHSWDLVPGDMVRTHRLMHLGLALFFGSVWLVGSRWRLSFAALTGIDTAGLLATSFAIASMTARAHTGHDGAMELVAAMLVLLAARAVIVPSSGKQTLTLSAAATAVSVATFTVHAVYRPVPDSLVTTFTLRDTAVTMAVWMILMTVTASVASRIIFGLRREIRVARQVGQYELLGLIGEGGMGIVYRATHALLRRDTALKLLPRASLSPERLARFEREVRQTARLTHPNTVAVFDYGRTPDGVFYYAMEYLDGIDLDRLVSLAGPLPVARAVHVLRQVLLSLTEAHEIGLVHRDIKPANVILCERGGESDVAKVVDFGLVKDLRGPESAGLTAAETITGTPLYLAPEAIRSPDDAGPASDLYAVAALGYYLLTGTHVFRAGSVMEICAHHLHTQPEPPSARLGRSLPESLDRLIMTGLEKQPDRRFASARAFREHLEACADVPHWSEADARAWWAEHRDQVKALHQGSPVEKDGRTVAVDLRVRS
jgi:eukaryotic-like serine/threonine-protein kinase